MGEEEKEKKKEEKEKKEEEKEEERAIVDSLRMELMSDESDLRGN